MGIVFLATLNIGFIFYTCMLYKNILVQRKMVLASPLQRLLLNFNCRARRTANLNLNCQTLIPKTHIVPNSFINGRPFSIGISPRKNNISYNNSAHSNFCRLREKSVFEHCKAQVVYQVPSRSKGHSKWQNIQHTKGANDRKNSQKILSYVNNIITAIKNNGNITD